MAEDPDLHWKALLRHYSLKKPLIAAVEGWAVAGGTEILQATDIRVAGESAKFGVFEARRGLFPLGGSTVRLRRQIPFTVAMDLLLDRSGGLGPGGQGDRPDRPGGARRDGPRDRPRDRRGDRGQRPAGRRGHQGLGQGDRGHPRGAGAWPWSWSSGGPSSPPRTPRRVRRPSPRSGPPNYQTPVSDLFEDDAPPGDPRRRLAAAIRPIITMNVAAELDDVALTEAAEAMEAIAERLTAPGRAQAHPQPTRPGPCRPGLLPHQPGHRPGQPGGPAGAGGGGRGRRRPPGDPRPGQLRLRLRGTAHLRARRGHRRAARRGARCGQHRGRAPRHDRHPHRPLPQARPR